MVPWVIIPFVLHENLSYTEFFAAGSNFFNVDHLSAILFSCVH